MRNVIFISVLLLFCGMRGSQFADEDPLGISPRHSTRFFTLNHNKNVREWFMGDTVSGGKIVFDFHEITIWAAGLAWCREPGSADNSTNQLIILLKDLKQDTSCLYCINGRNKKFIHQSFTKTSNIGGYNSEFYGQEYISPLRLLHWDKNDFEPIDSLEKDNFFGTADIAVDAAGNAWYCQLASNNTEATAVKKFSLVGCRPDGTLIRRVPIEELQGPGFYGFMLINGIFYIAGTNKIIELKFENEVMKPARTIDFVTNAHDVASEDPGTPKFD
jgi:hypothetical protein